MWASSSSRRSGPCWAGTSWRAGGCGSGSISGVRRGRSTRMPAAWPSTCSLRAGGRRPGHGEPGARRGVRPRADHPSRAVAGPNVVSIDSGAGLSNATIQQRLVPVRLFYDHLDRGRAARLQPGRARHVHARPAGSAAGERGAGAADGQAAVDPRRAQWLPMLAGRSAGEPIRNRVMLALAYDAALRREELCSLRTETWIRRTRMLRVRAETTKNRRGARGAVLGADRGAAAGYLAAPGRRSAGPAGRCSCRSRAATTAEPLTLVDLVEGRAADRR